MLAVLRDVTVLVRWGQGALGITGWRWFFLLLFFLALASG